MEQQNDQFIPLRSLAPAEKQYLTGERSAGYRFRNRYKRRNIFSAAPTRGAELIGGRLQNVAMA